MRKLLKSYIDNKISFCAFRMPNENKVKLILVDKVKSINFSDLENLPQNTFVMFPFDVRGLNSLAFLSKSVEEISYSDNCSDESFKLETIFDFFSDSEFDKYKGQFTNMLNSFESGLANKAILSKLLKVENFEVSLLPDVYSRLLIEYPSTFAFIVSSPETGMWMGASPELLFSKSDEIGKTFSLAGTRSKDDDIDSWTAKEREEQGIVTNFIDKVLENNNIDNYKKEEIQLVKMGNISHLKTVYEFKLNSDFQWSKIVEDLHPTPAIGGDPKNISIDLINNVEPHNREYYCGFLGFIDKDVNLYVNLRSMKIENNDLKIFVGGGLTKKSNLEDEWNELKLKSQILLSIL